MPIPEDEYKKLKCCLDNTHIVHEAISMKCGGNACKNCIDLMKLDFIKCCYCNENHKKDEIKSNLIPNSEVETEIRTKYLNDLIEDLKVKISNTYEALKDEVLNDEIENRINIMENDIDVRIESLIDELHKIRDEMKRDFKKKKDEFLRSKVSENIKNLRDKLPQALNNFTDYDDFVKNCDILRDCQLEHKNYLENIQQIRFTPNETSLEKNIIGDLDMPYTEYKKVKSRKIISVESDEVEGLVWLQNENKIVAIDSQTSVLILDLDGQILEKLEHQHLTMPIMICKGVGDEFLIYDQSSYHLLVFDTNIKFIRETIIGESIYTGSFMKIDPYDKDHLLYVGNCDAHKVMIINTMSGRSKNAIQLEAPYHLEFTEDKVFVLSLTSFMRDSDSEKLVSYKGDNCIFVLRKRTHDVIKVIKFDDWYQPYGLSIDNDGNVLTVANEISDDYKVSPEWYLNVISQSGFRKKKIDLGFVDDCRALSIYGNRIILSKYNGLEFIDLE